MSGVVQPLSPVFLHVGGEINFRVESTESTATGGRTSNSGNNNSGGSGSSPQVLWSSSNPNTLAIESETGKAIGQREGKADVLLSNHQNAASIVHVSKVAYA